MCVYIYILKNTYMYVSTSSDTHLLRPFWALDFWWVSLLWFWPASLLNQIASFMGSSTKHYGSEKTFARVYDATKINPLEDIGTIHHIETIHHFT